MEISDKTRFLFGTNSFEILNFINDDYLVEKKYIEKKFPDITNLDNILKQLLDWKFVSVDNFDKYKLTDEGMEKISLFLTLNDDQSFDELYKVFSKVIRANFYLLSETRMVDALFYQLKKPHDKYNIKQVMICSPWISLTGDQKKILLDLKNKKKIPIIFITRKPSREHVNVITTLQFLKENKFEVRELKQLLHTKLYLIERSDIYENVVIFGSENLTNRNMKELGMIIRDEHIYNKCQTYFDDIFANSQELNL